jgi:hypothetical protein
MQAGILRPAGFGDHARGDLRWLQSATNNVGVVLDVAGAIRKNQVKLALRTSKTVLAQCRDQRWRQGDDALASFRLRPPDGVEAIGALTHMQLAALQFDVLPAQAAQLGGAKAGEDCGQDEGPPALVEMSDDGANLIGRRDVDADPGACPSAACRRARPCRACDGCEELGPRSGQRGHALARRPGWR